MVCLSVKHDKQKLVYSKAAHENHNFTRVTRLSQKRTRGGDLPLKKVYT